MRAAELLTVNPSDGRDSLIMLRLDALESAPDLARSLEGVLSSIATGGDVTSPLVRARRTLVRPQRAIGLPSWSTP
jgi:hypothetical protein